MRLQLAAAVLAALSGSRGAQAQIAVESGARVDVYTDAWLGVVSPTVRATVTPSDALSFQARYGVDIVSGATPAVTVDAVSSATRMEEERHFFDGGLRYAPSPTTAFGAGYFVSVESDASTHAPGLWLSTELLERAVVARLAYRLELGDVGLATDDAYSVRATGHVLDAEWTHILDARTVAALSATLEVTRCGERLGCHASPYRYVAVFTGGASAEAAGDFAIALPERHPDERIRGAGALRLAHAFGDGWAAHGSYRLYGDSWQVVGHTGHASASKELGATGILMRLEGRLTWQSAASFYRARYDRNGGDATPAYRSGDREISGLTSALGGLRVEYTSPPVAALTWVRASVRVAHVWFHYPRFPALPERRAWLVGGGLDAAF